MNKNIFFKTTLTASLLVLGILTASFSKAAQDSSIIVQPSRFEVNATLGQKISKRFSLINRSNFNVSFKVVVQDYKQKSEDGKLEFYNAESEPASQWLIPQYVQISLKPLETKDVGFIISVPDNFSEGGHYGAVIFEAIDDNQNLALGNFGALVLLTVNGNDAAVAATAQTISFSTNLVSSGNTVDFKFKAKNEGNTQFSSTGKLVLKDLFGKEVASFDVGRLIIYPNTSRLFEWRWTDTPSFGAYRAQIMLADASGNNLKSAGGSWFIIFPWQITFAVILLLAATILVIKYRRNVFRKISWANKKLNKTYLFDDWNY